MQWQILWKHWHFGYDRIPDDYYDIDHCYLFIGPLQIKWYSRGGF